MARIMIAGSGYPKSTGALVGDIARARGHQVGELDALDEDRALEQQLADADAVVLIPKRGDVWRHTHQATLNLAAAAARRAEPVHFVLLSSFAVGHGPAHPLNRIDAALLPGRVVAEHALVAGGLPYTIVRTTWLTDDPAGSHAVTLTQHPHADGMVARADVATAMVAAIEQPAARDTVFALFNEPGDPPADWADSFARLRHGSLQENLA